MTPCTRKQGPRARVATAGEGVEARSTLGLPPRGGRSARARGARNAVATVEGRRGDALDPRAAPRRGGRRSAGWTRPREGEEWGDGKGKRCRLTRRGNVEAGAGGRYRAAGRDPAEEKEEEEKEGERERREREREEIEREKRDRERRKRYREIRDI